MNQDENDNIMGLFHAFRVESVFAELLAGVAKELNLIGSINVQLRLTERGPIIFEINPRFSSTVVFRHLIGFEDLIWSINNKFGQPIANYMEPKVGKEFYRGASEIFLKS